MSPTDDEVPGLQPERTLLAWVRTVLATVVVAGLLLRLVGPPLTRAAHLPALAVLVVAGWLFVASDRRYRHDERRTQAVPAGQLLVLTVAVVGLGGVAVVALLAR